MASVGLPPSVTLRIERGSDPTHSSFFVLRLPAPARRPREEILPRLAAFLEAEICRPDTPWNFLHVRAPRSGGSSWVLAAGTLVASTLLVGRGALQKLLLGARALFSGSGSPENIFDARRVRAACGSASFLDGLALLELRWAVLPASVHNAEDNGGATDVLQAPSAFAVTVDPESSSSCTPARRAQLLAHHAGAPPDNVFVYVPGRLAFLRRCADELATAGLLAFPPDAPPTEAFALCRAALSAEERSGAPRRWQDCEDEDRLAFDVSSSRCGNCGRPVPPCMTPLRRQLNFRPVDFCREMCRYRFDERHRFCLVPGCGSKRFEPYSSPDVRNLFSDKGPRRYVQSFRCCVCQAFFNLGRGPGALMMQSGSS